MKNAGMKIHLAAAIAMLVPGPAARATTVIDLKIECGGRYEVLESEPYYRSNEGTRKDPEAGTKEKIRVVSLEGAGCGALEADYGIAIAPGDTLGYGVSTSGDYAKAQALSKERPGKSFEFKAVQSFGYLDGYGALPLFPSVHEEWVSVLSLSGRADAAKKYGTPAKADLPDTKKAEILEDAFWILDWGKGEGSLSWHQGDWLSLVLDPAMEPKDGVLAKEYVGDLALFFENLTSGKSSLTTHSDGARVGARLNELLNAHGGSKFQDKLGVLKRLPMLLDDQIVSWAAIGIPSKDAYPKLHEVEVEALLDAYYDQATRFQQVPELTAARIKLAQIRAAAASIGSSGLYALTRWSRERVEAILELK